MALDDATGPTGPEDSHGFDGPDDPDGPDDLDGDAALPCGRRLSRVWERRDEDAAHVAACAHCQEALARLGALEDYVRRARAAEPERVRAQEVSARVMDLVRAELRPGRPLPLGGPGEDAWIAENAAAKALRRAAESLPGVIAGSCRITPAEPGTAHRPPIPARAAERGPLRVRLELAATVRAAAEGTVPGLAARVRRAVAEAARDAVGMEVVEIDVSVVDILDEATDGQRRGPGEGSAS